MEEKAGWITFGIGVDDKKFKEAIKDAENTLKEFDKEGEKLLKEKNKLEIDTKEAREQIEELDQRIEELKRKQERIQANPYKVGGAADVLTGRKITELEEQKASLMDEIKSKYDLLDREIEQNNQKKDEEAKKLEELIKKYREYKMAQEGKGPGITGGDGFSFKNVGKSLTGVISKTAKWGLALMGIRSIYGLLSNAAAQLEKTNKQTAVNLQYIRTALATALEPIITWLVNMLGKLLQIVNTIIYKLTGRNIFAEAKKNLQSGVKSAKQLQKTLAGFDEMNILGKNTTASGGGGSPEPFDLSKIIDLDKLMNEVLDKLTDPDWWINVGKKIINFLWDGMWLAIDVNETVQEMIKKKLYQRLGIDESDGEDAGEKFIKALINGIGKGLQVAFAPWTVFGGIGKALGLDKKSAGEIVDDFIRGLKEYFTLKMGPLGTFFRVNFNTIAQAIIDGLKIGLKSGIATLLGPFGLFIDAVRNIFGIHSPSTVFADMGVNIIKGLVNGINSVINTVLTPFNTIKGKIQSSFSGLNIKDAVVKAFKNAMNGAIEMVNKAINSINSKLKLEWKDIKIAGKTIISKGSIDFGKIPTIPKLAKGGIINLPGRGVPLAVGGESGREGVIPLTDEQQMQILGESIGKYVVINLTSITQLDGRDIARRTSQVSNENAFLMNR